MMWRAAVRRRAVFVVALATAVSGSVVNGQGFDRPKEVLVLNSTRQNEQFYIVSELEMPKLLAHGLERGVNYYTEYLDANRFPDPRHEAAYVDFLRRKYAGRHMDLLVVMGNAAMDFMIRQRTGLFSDTPVVYYTLTPLKSALANSTGLLNTFNFGRSIDLAVALQPNLERVYVVSGAGVSDRVFENQARAEFRRYEGQIAFTYLSGLVTRELDARLKTLPPRSAVYYVVVTRDGAGETFRQMDYLSRVAAVANAPTYSWADVSVDAGIVGGRRRDQLRQMQAIAAVALRVLRGEPADAIPVSSPDTDVDAVDWRQLRRWGLDGSRVPAGTRILFRPPGMWEQYSRYIIGAFVLILAQSALIAGLLMQRTKRRRVERVLRGNQVKLRLSYNRIRQLSRRLLGEQEAERARIARELHDDINQQLTLLSLDLDRLSAEPLQAHTAMRLSRALQTVHGVANSVRELSHRLHPSRLRLIGLVAGLDTLRRELSPPDLPIAFSHRGVPDEIDQEVALCIFRVAQEALANAVKHSDARHVWVDLTGGPSGLRLTIRDDGKGFELDRMPNAGLGLTSMRERVETVGGVLEILAAPAAGTRLKITVPIRVAEPALDAVPFA
jgi:signal transduction histidine kinase